MNNESIDTSMERGQRRPETANGGQAGQATDRVEPSTGEEPSLTPSQQLALPALLTCPTVRAATRQLREEALSQAATHLQQGATRAVGAMYNLIDSDRLIETGRAALIRTALDFAFRSGAYGDLADRIADLEKAAPEDKK